MAGFYDDWDARKSGAPAETSQGATVRATPVIDVPTGATTPYGRKALDDEAAKLGQAVEPGRNDALNEAAFSVYQLVFAGHISEDDARAELSAVGRRIGLTVNEIIKTMGSARSAAQVKGRRDVPEPNAGAGVVWDLPQVTRPPWTAGDEAMPDILSEEAGSEDYVSPVILPVINWHDLWADDSGEDWICEPLLPAGRLVAVYSEPKVGKSLICLELGIAVSLGRPVLGGVPERPYRVLYVDFENDPKGDVRPRAEAMGYGPDDLANLAYLSFPALPALDSERGGLELMANVEHYGAEVVVIDTVSRAVAGEENANDTWLNFYRRTGLRLKAAGVSLLRLDHAGKDPTKGQRGGSAKVGDVDMVWRLSRVTDTVLQLDCEAHRMALAPEMKTIALHREEDPLRHRVDARGWRATADAKVQELISIFDEAGAAPDAGFRVLKSIKDEYQAKNPAFRAGDPAIRKARDVRQRRVQIAIL